MGRRGADEGRGGQGECAVEGGEEEDERWKGWVAGFFDWGEFEFVVLALLLGGDVDEDRQVVGGLSVVGLGGGGAITALSRGLEVDVYLPMVRLLSLHKHVTDTGMRSDTSVRRRVEANSVEYPEWTSSTRLVALIQDILRLGSCIAATRVVQRVFVSFHPEFRNRGSAAH